MKYFRNFTANIETYEFLKNVVAKENNKISNDYVFLRIPHDSTPKKKKKWNKFCFSCFKIYNSLHDSFIMHAVDARRHKKTFICYDSANFHIKIKKIKKYFCLRKKKENFLILKKEKSKLLSWKKFHHILMPCMASVDFLYVKDR